MYRFTWLVWESHSGSYYAVDGSDQLICLKQQTVSELSKSSKSSRCHYDIAKSRESVSTSTDDAIVPEK